MTFISKRHISRRAVLRGAGVALSLPFLESMVPAQTPLAKTAANPKLRLALCFMPHGAVLSNPVGIDNWTPAKVGPLEFSRILAPLEAHKKDVLVLSNLAHAMAGPQGAGDNGGDHTRCPAVFLNGVHPKRTDGADIWAGVTIDQMAAAAIGQDTPLPSLELATEDFSGLVGSCDVGFSCTYMNTISWKTNTTPLPMEINPRVVFDRMFGDGATASERLQRIAQQRSILDAVTSQMNRLQGKLPSVDKVRVSEYLDTVREIERRIQLSEKQNNNPDLSVPVSPSGIPEDHQEHSKMMFDLMTLAFQAEITRVSAYMMAREVSYRTFPMLGISEGFHPASHHSNSKERLEQFTKINTYHSTLVAHFLDKLRATPDGDGTLLDHSLVLYGSAMSNSNVHDHGPLPILVAGGANGQLKGGRHLKYPENTPMSNLLLSIVQKAGLNIDKVGDSTGPLADI